MATASGTTYGSATSATLAAPAGTSPDAPLRRLRRERDLGPRCPQCAGPLVFGEGCSVCPVCGHSSCAV